MSGAQNGIKIRLPRALVMVFMFRSDLDSRGKLRVIARAVTERATSLAPLPPFTRQRYSCSSGGDDNDTLVVGNTTDLPWQDDCHPLRRGLPRMTWRSSTQMT